MPEFFHGNIPFSTLALIGFAGYFMGSISFGMLTSRLAGLGDIRQIGSGNIGATNVLRTGHKGLAAATLMGDLLKGTVATCVGLQYGLTGGLIGGFFAFLGHLFPLWLKFKGGKGIATYLGVLLGLHWPSAVIFCLLWGAVAFLTRLSSLSALVASLFTLLTLALFQQSPILLPFTVMTLLIFWRHSANIKRLLKGQESRIGAGK